MTVPHVPLLEVADLVKDRVDPFTGHRPYVATGDLTDDGVCASTPVTFQDRPSRATLQVRPGDVCTARMRDTTKVFLFRDGHQDLILSSGFALFRPDASVLDGTYLKHWFKTRAFQATKNQHCSGAIQPAITNRGLAELSVPLPPLDVQRRTAAVLEAADLLCARRRHAFSRLDDLGEAIFVDMFGDQRHPTHWAFTSLADVATVVTGNTPPRSEPANYGSHIEWIKSDNIGLDGQVGPAAEKLSEIGRERGREAPVGSSLVVCIAGSPSSIGRTGLLDRPAAFNQQINAVIPGDRTRPTFLFQLLRMSQQRIQRLSTNSMKGMVTKSALCSLPVSLPPLSEQDLFADRMSVVQALRASATSSSLRFDLLFASLQQRAFRGDL